MDSSEILNKTNTSYFKRQKSGHSNNQIKAIPKFNSINSPMSSYLVFTHNLLGSSKGLGLILGLCPLQHTGLPSRLWQASLHGSYCPCWPSHGNAISKIAEFPCCNWTEFPPHLLTLKLNFYEWPLQSWALNCHQDSIFTNGLFWSLKVLSLSCSKWPFHAFRKLHHGDSYYKIWLPVQGTTLATYGIQFLCADSEEALPEYFISVMLVPS